MRGEALTIGVEASKGMGEGAGYTLVDGADPELKPVRSALWELSGQREYPQVFVHRDGVCSFVGNMDAIQELIDGGGFDARRQLLPH